MHELPLLLYTDLIFRPIFLTARNLQFIIPSPNEPTNTRIPGFFSLYILTLLLFSAIFFFGASINFAIFFYFFEYQPLQFEGFFLTFSQWLSFSMAGSKHEAFQLRPFKVCLNFCSLSTNDDE